MEKGRRKRRGMEEGKKGMEKGRREWRREERGMEKGRRKRRGMEMESTREMIIFLRDETEGSDKNV